MAKRSRKKKTPDHNVASSAPNSTTPLWSIWVPLLLAIVAFLTYWPSLKSDFVYDAHIEMIDEGFITSLSNLPDILSLKVLGMNLVLGDRPGQMLYLMLNAAIWGKEPFGYHLSSNLLHALDVALLYILLRRLIAPEVIGLGKNGTLRIQFAIVAVVLIFALHPIVVESVSEVSFSSSLLVTFFTLTALLAATSFRPENFRVAIIAGGIGTLCAFASVTSKESGITTALMLIVYWFLFRRREAKGPWLLFFGAAVAVTVAFLAARFLLAPSSQAHLGYLGGSFFQVFLIQPRLWVFMMGQLLWPARLSADYTLENADGLSTSLALVILAVVVLLQVWLACKSRLGALGVATYWLSLATVSNFVPLFRLSADRFYYLSLAGVAMQLLAMLLMLVKSRRGFWLLLAPCFGVLLPLIFLTVTREAVFANEFSLWSDTVQASPFSSIAQSNYGSVLADKGRVDEAIQHIEKAVEISPYYDQGHNQLGVALSKKGRMDEGMEQFKIALKINPKLADARSNLGNSLLQKGQVDEAIVQYLKALEISSNSVDAHYNMGLALYQKGQLDDAIIQYKKALDINPKLAEAHNSLGLALFQKGQLDDAMFQLQQAVKIDPTMAEAHNNLGNGFSQKGQVDEALAQYKKAIEINPDMAPACNGLGNMLFQKGQVDEAMSQYQKALKINPDMAQAHNGLGNALFQKGQIEEALAQFQEAVRLKPDYGNAQNNLARAKAAAGQKSANK